MALTRPPAATRLSLHPATTWIFRKTRSFPSLAHTRFGFSLGFKQNAWPGDLAPQIDICQERMRRKNPKKTERASTVSCLTAVADRQQSGKIERDCILRRQSLTRRCNHDFICGPRRAIPPGGAGSNQDKQLMRHSTRLTPPLGPLMLPILLVLLYVMFAASFFRSTFRSATHLAPCENDRRPCRP